MSQDDLFDRLKAAAFPSTAVAEARRDRAIESVARDHEWQERALEFVEHYAQSHASFMAEDVREAARLLGEPHDGRAWGSVFKRAQTLGLIRADGFAAARTSNMSPKVKWKSLICEV